MPRSPVYGGNAGNLNMRGKKEIRMRCGCCTALDLREIERIKEAHREIRGAMKFGVAQNDDLVLRGDLPSG